MHHGNAAILQKGGGGRPGIFLVSGCYHPILHDAHSVARIFRRDSPLAHWRVLGHPGTKQEKMKGKWN